MRTSKWAIALILIAIGGCVTLTPQQQDTVTEVQRFADATTAAYKLYRIRVTIEPATNLGIGGRYRQGNFYLNERMLGSSSLTALVAHELAHYVLGHDTPVQGTSMAEFQRAQELRELDANAKAVEILVRVKEMTELQAVRTMVSYLKTAQAFQERGGARAWGHRPPAEEIAGLLARFGGLDAPTESRSATQSVTPGEIVGSAYVNRPMRYTFQVPSGWLRREEERYRGVELAVSPRNQLETVIFAMAQGGSTQELIQLGAPREVHGQEQLQWLLRLVPELKPEEHPRVSVRVVKPSAYTFLVITGPPVCSFSERLRTQQLNRAWDHVAATGTNRHTYVFMGNLCAAGSSAAFDRVLETFQVLE